MKEYTKKQKKLNFQHITWKNTKHTLNKIISIISVLSTTEASSTQIIQCAEPHPEYLIIVPTV